MALLLPYFLGLISEFLDLKNRGGKLPEEVTDVYSVQEFSKSEQYSNVKTRFSLLESTFSIVISFVLIFGGVYAGLDNYLRSIIPEGEIYRGLAFAGCLGILQSLLSLPFELYGTFSIEERFVCVTAFGGKMYALR